MRTITVLLFCASLGFGQDNSLERLYDLAAAQSPALAGMSAEVRAAESMTRVNMALMDPMLSVEGMELPLVTDPMATGPMSEWKLSLTQTVPFPGKLISQGQARERDLALKRLDYEVMFNAMKRDIALMYYGLAAQDLVIGALATRLDQLGALEEIVAAGYRTGRATFAEYSRTRIMAAMAAADLVSMRAERATMARSLARMIGVSALPADLAFTLPAATEIKSTRDGLVDRSRAVFPEAVRGSVLVEKARAETNVASWDLAPDLTLGLSLNLPSSGGTYFSFMAGISLPVFFAVKQAPAIQAAQAMQEAAVKGQNELYNRIDEDIANNLASYRANLAVTKTFEDSILADAQASLAVSNREYAAGKKDLKSLLDEMTALYDYQSQAIKSNQALAGNLVTLRYYLNFSVLPGEGT
jgi:outer membrane protein TolC